MTYVTVAEIAAKCGVTPQGVNAYLRKSGLQKQAVKKGNKFLLDSDLAEKVETHFGLIDSPVSDSDSETVETTTKTETFTETTETDTETVSETTETDKTPDKAALLQVELDQLRIRLEEKQSQIDYLQTQLDKVTDLNRALTLENAAYVTKLLKAPEEDQEPEEIEIQEEESENAGNQHDQPQEQQPHKVMTFGEWFKQRFFS